MALPKQINFDLQREEYREAFNFFDGKKNKKTKLWLISILSFIIFSALVFIVALYIGACEYVNNALDYSTFSLERFNMSGAITAVCLIVLSIITLIIIVKVINSQNEKLLDIYYSRYGKGVVVMGNESFLFRSGTDGFEVNQRYGDLYEAHENENYFLLITYDDDQIAVPKENLDRDTYSKISMILTDEVKEFFFKMGRSNFDLNDHVLIKKPDKRAEIRKLGR